MPTLTAASGLSRPARPSRSSISGYPHALTKLHMHSPFALERYCSQSPNEEPFYLPRLLLEQTKPQSSRDAPKPSRTVLRSTSSLAKGSPPGLTKSSASALSSSSVSDLSTFSKNTFISNSDRSQLFPATSTDPLVHKKHLDGIGIQFGARVGLSREPQQHGGWMNVSDDFSEHRPVRLGHGHSPDVAPDNKRVSKKQRTTPTPLNETASQSCVDQLLEEKFRLLFKTSPNLLALYGCVHRGNGESNSSARGDSGDRGNPPDAKGNQHFRKGDGQTGNNTPGRDANDQDDSDEKDDKNHKKKRPDLAKERFLRGFPDQEFLCVILVGDPVRASHAHCAHHCPDIFEIFRHLENTHKTRFPQIGDVLWEVLEKHKPTKKTSRDPIALWKTWYGILFSQKKPEPGSWYYDPGPKQPLLNISTPADGKFADLNQPRQAPVYHVDDQTNLKSIEEAVHFAKQEAIEIPDIVIAISTYGDDLHQLERRRDRAEEEVKEQYENDLREAQSTHKLGEKRARDTRNVREKQVQEDFTKAKSEIDDMLKRKISCARQARQQFSLPPHHEAFNIPFPAINPAAVSTAPSPYLPVPPSTPRTGLGGSGVLSDGPILEEGNATPRSTNTRLSSSRDGYFSPRTPAANIGINPLIIDASAAGASVGGSASGRLDFEARAGTYFPSSPGLTTEFCLSTDCHRKALQDRSYCADHDWLPSPSP